MTSGKSSCIISKIKGSLHIMKDFKVYNILNFLDFIQKCVSALVTDYKNPQKRHRIEKYNQIFFFFNKRTGINYVFTF